MWSTTSILLVLLSIFGIINCYEFSSDGPHFRGIASSDDSESIVKTFLEKMTKTIETKDSGLLSDLFSDQFLFHGCKGDYDKKKVITILSQIPSGTTFSITLKSSKYLSTDQIEYFVTVSGFGIDQPIDAQFVLCKSSGMLSGGSIPACKKTHSFVHSHQDINWHPFFHGFISQDSAQMTIEKFLKRMISSIESQDESIISGLFEPGFILKGCKGIYDKTKIVSLLTQIPAGSKFNFALKSVEDLGSSIKYLVSASGFDKTDVNIEFVLNKNDQQLESGSVPECQKSRGIVSLVSAQTTIENFLARMKKSVDSGDKTVIAGLFEPNFSFNGCSTIFDKEQSVAMLMLIPPGTKFSYKIKSIEDNGSTIKGALLATGLSVSDVEFDFVFNRNDQKLESAAMPSCAVPSRRFAQTVNSDDVINQFLAAMKQTIASHDSNSIGNIFDDNFSFIGCHGQYNKAQIVAMIFKDSQKVPLDFKLKSSKYNNYGQIEYLVSISGASSHQVQAEFVYCPYRNVLKSGRDPTCAARRFRGFY